MRARRTGKKAVEQYGLLAGIVVVVVIAIVLFIFQSSLQATIKKGTDIEACEASVRAVSAMGTASFVDITCPTQIITVKPDGAYRRSIRSPQEEKYLVPAAVERRLIAQGTKAPTQYQVLAEMARYVLAMEMEQCWRKFGEGNLQPFQTKVIIGGNRCITCATVAYDPAFQAAISKAHGDYVQGLMGFRGYLNQTKMDDKDMTYEQYLLPQLGTLNLPGFDKAEYNPGNFWLLDTEQAGGHAVVQVEHTIMFNETAVVTYISANSVWLDRWSGAIKRQVVSTYPSWFPAQCDVLY